MKKNLVIYDGNCRLCKMFSKMIVSPHFELIQIIILMS